MKISRNKWIFLILDSRYICLQNCVCNIYQKKKKNVSSPRVSVLRNTILRPLPAKIIFKFLRFLIIKTKFGWVYSTCFAFFPNDIKIIYSIKKNNNRRKEKFCDVHTDSFTYYNDYNHHFDINSFDLITSLLFNVFNTKCVIQQFSFNFDIFLIQEYLIKHNYFS